MYNSKKFWEYLDKLVSENRMVIDRPKGSCYPKFKETIYPLDYGYISGTLSMDSEGIDIFIGSLNENFVDSIAVTIDLFNKDSEIAILYNCSENEKKIIYNFINKYETMKGIIINRK